MAVAGEGRLPLDSSTSTTHDDRRIDEWARECKGITVHTHEETQAEETETTTATQAQAHCCSGEMEQSDAAAREKRALRVRRITRRHALSLSECKDAKRWTIDQSGHLDMETLASVRAHSLPTTVNLGDGSAR